MSCDKCCVSKYHIYNIIQLISYISGAFHHTRFPGSFVEKGLQQCFLNVPKCAIVSLIFLQAFSFWPLFLNMSERQRGNETARENCTFCAQVETLNSNEWVSPQLTQPRADPSLSLLTACVCATAASLHHSVLGPLPTYLSNSWFQHAAEDRELLKVASFAGEVFNVWKKCIKIVWVRIFVIFINLL